MARRPELGKLVHPSARRSGDAGWCTASMRLRSSGEQGNPALWELLLGTRCKDSAGHMSMGLVTCIHNDVHLDCEQPVQMTVVCA